jgi:hypothetical protein
MCLFCFSSPCVSYVASFSVLFFALCILCCQFLCAFLRLVYPMLPVSLCFSSPCVSYVASFSVLFFALCILCCQFLCVFLRLVYPMLPVSLDCPLLIAPSVFSYVYISQIHPSVIHFPLPETYKSHVYCTIITFIHFYKHNFETRRHNKSCFILTYIIYCNS